MDIESSNWLFLYACHTNSDNVLSATLLTYSSHEYNLHDVTQQAIGELQIMQRLMNMFVSWSDYCALKDY